MSCEHVHAPTRAARSRGRQAGGQCPPYGAPAHAVGRALPAVRCHPRRGFSLLEMMFVFVLIGLLAGLVTVNARYYLVRGKQNAARAEIARIATALETFYSAAGRYPDNDEGLAVLATKSDQFPEPLLNQLPRDPWGREYQYNRPGRNGPYEVICFGADGRDGGEGADKDIGSWDLKEKAAGK